MLTRCTDCSAARVAKAIDITYTAFCASAPIEAPGVLRIPIGAKGLDARTVCAELREVLIAIKGLNIS